MTLGGTPEIFVTPEIYACDSKRLVMPRFCARDHQSLMTAARGSGKGSLDLASEACVARFNHDLAG